MLTIGLNENVFLEKASFDERGNVEIVFQETTMKEKAASPFASLASDEVVEGNTGMGIKLFPPLPTKKEDVTQEKKLALIDADLNKTKGILRHIMLQYISVGELANVWKDMFAGIPISEASYDQQIQLSNILELVHKSMGRIFLEKIKPFLNRKDLAMRLLLVRQSKDKHYATFRGKYLDESPFLETMEIPLSASKLAVLIDPKDPSKGYGPKWTKYELEQGLTHGMPAEKKADPKDGSGGGGTAETKQAPQSAASIFGTS